MVEKTPWSGFGLVAVSYVLAGLVALVVSHFLPVEHPLAIAAVGDVAATLVVFGFSRAFNNTSFYDPYWSVGPIAIALYLMLVPGHDVGLLARQIMVLGVVSLWGWRLTFNWVRGWSGLSDEDWRYVDMRQQTGRFYWWASLGGLHLLPTVLVFFGCVPLYYALSTPGRAFGALDVIGGAVTLAAAIIEAVSDEQLRSFRKRGESGGICDDGLWKYSRHPNYFGELLFWVGVWLMGMAAGAPWWTAGGALAMVALFVFASIPMAEKRSLKRRPEYQKRIDTVSMVVPLPPRSR